MDTIKLLGVVLPPVIALATISYLSFGQAMKTMNDAQELSDHLTTSETNRRLIHMLQRERGIACIFLESDG